MKDKNLRIYTKVFEDNGYQHLMNIKFDEIEDVMIETCNIERILIEHIR